MFLITFLIFAGFSLKAQAPAGSSSALNYTGLENKLKKSDAEIQDPKKNTKAKTWTSRANLLVDIFNVNNDVLRKGMDATSVKLFYKEPKEVQTFQQGGDKIENYIYERVTLTFLNGLLDTWTETVRIHPDPLGEAQKAIDEAVKVNADGKANSDIKDAIIAVKAALETEAVSAYEKKNFKASHAAFVQILNLNKQPLMAGVVDTLIMYYGGRAALENGDYKESNRLFEEAAANKFEDPFLYVFSKQSYFESGDTASGVKVITEGYNKYPDNQSIMIEIINYYLISNQGEEALKLLAKAKASDPENVSYPFAEGTLYDKMGRFEEAEKAYMTCIEMKPDFLDASYNLGVIYYNKAVKIYEEASKITSNDEYEKAKTEGDNMLLKAVPYMEKVVATEAKDAESLKTRKYALESLKTIFYRLKMDDKYKEVVSKLNEI